LASRPFTVRVWLPKGQLAGARGDVDLAGAADDLSAVTVDLVRVRDIAVAGEERGDCLLLGAGSCE